MSKKSLISLKSLTGAQIEDLFSLALSFYKNPKEKSVIEAKSPIALVFLEPSTRTRMSFEIAAQLEGYQTVVFDGAQGSSLEKGESFEDTILNIAAMRPSAIVLRSNDTVDFTELNKIVSMPLINAGWGIKGHPTQALLDALTIVKNRGQIRGEKLLIIGDIRHSRVAASHMELAAVLGYEVGFAGPKHFLPESGQFKIFSQLSEGLKWADNIMALRVQLERHNHQIDLADYHSLWGLNKNNLSLIKKDAVILHPGPINWGIEMSKEVLEDSRQKILEQVTFGVCVRRAIIHQMMETV